MWEAATGEEIARMTYVGGVNSVAFSPNGKYIVSGGCDQHGSSFMCIQGSARVWEAATGKEIAQTNYDHDVYAVVFSPDGKYVASGGCDQLGSGYSPCAQGSARVWEPQTGKEIARMTHDGSVVAVAFSLDGKYVVSGSSDGMARVWEITTGKEIASVTHDESVFSVGFSPDRKYVVSAGGYTASVWEAATGKVVASSYHAALGPSTPVISVALSPDGKYVVSGGADGAAIVLEAATGEQITYITHDADGSEVSVAFSPDGTYVVSASSAGTTRLWESFTGKEIAQMMGDSVHSVTFSPDGKYVASGGADTVRVWVYRPVDLIAESCFRVTHNLTYEEWDQYIGDTLPYQAVCPDLPLDLEYIKAIARDLLSNSDDPNRVRTTLDRVQAELIKVGVAKDPMTESLSIVSSAIVRRLSSEVTAGDREKTLDLFEQARQIQMQISVDDKDALNEICWDGSLNGYEQQVLQYCESAVRVAPSDANIRDSRGLARALTGDYQGAILDFQYFVDNTTLRYLIGQRKEWIEKLKSEINPFTPEVLESLKQPPQMPSEPEPDMTPTPSPLPTAQIAPTTMNTPVPCPILTLAPSSALTNINTASQCELESLPGIGPTIAQKIIEYRTQNGPFQSIEDIINVSGIGPGTFERIKNLITV